MRKLYSSFLYISFVALLFYAQKSAAQCAGGSPSGTAAFDTTVSFGIGVSATQIKFPKFNPQTAMLSCVRLVVTMVGVVNHVGMQNLSTTNTNQARFFYNRTDNMNGPGLTPALNNSLNGQYGPYNLTTYDGTAGSGSDFHAITNDTILKKTMSRTLTDSVTISEFYGTDSLTYNYDMSLFTYASFTADNSSSVSTSALVNFRLEYCTCPLAALPVGMKNFTVQKSGNEADLRWEAEAGTDRYYYEVEVSRDGRKFSKAALIDKNNETGNAAYRFAHAIKPNEYGRYYFRVKQRWLDGYYRYSEVRSVEYTNPVFSTVSIYPNPSTGNIGLKFVAGKAGTYLVQVSNAGGQILVSKELRMAQTDYKQVASLQKGTYYVKITEQVSQSSTINQIIIQ